MNTIIKLLSVKLVLTVTILACLIPFFSSAYAEFSVFSTHWPPYIVEHQERSDGTSVKIITKVLK